MEHVDTLDVSDNPQIGDRIGVRALVRLGGLETDSVSVQVVHGQALDTDELTNTSTVTLTPGEDLGDGRHEFTGALEIERSGSFGYTVRVLPQHHALANIAELGLIASA